MKSLSLIGKLWDHKKKTKTVQIVTLSIFLAHAVPLFSCIKKNKSKSLREAFLIDSAHHYMCNLALLGNSSLSNIPVEIVLAWSTIKSALPPHANSQTKNLLNEGNINEMPSQAILVYIKETEDPLSAIQLIYDPGTLRVDRILQVDGKPVGTSLISDTITIAEAERMALAAIGLLLIEEAPMALAEAKKQVERKALERNSKPQESDPFLSLLSKGMVFSTSHKVLVNAVFKTPQPTQGGPGQIPLAEKISTAGQVACKKIEQ